MKRSNLLSLSLSILEKKDQPLTAYSDKGISMTGMSHIVTSAILLTQLLASSDLTNLTTVCQFDEKEQLIHTSLLKQTNKSTETISKDILKNIRTQLMEKLGAGLKNGGNDSPTILNFQTILGQLLNYDNILNEKFPNFLSQPLISTELLTSLFKMLGVELIIEKKLELLESKDESTLFKSSAQTLLKLIRESQYPSTEISLQKLAESHSSWRSWTFSWNFQSIDARLVEIITSNQDVIFNENLRDKFFFYPKKISVEFNRYMDIWKRWEEKDNENFKQIYAKMGDLPDFKQLQAQQEIIHDAIKQFRAGLIKFKESPLTEQYVQDTFIKNYCESYSSLGLRGALISKFAEIKTISTPIIPAKPLSIALSPATDSDRREKESVSSSSTPKTESSIAQNFGSTLLESIPPDLKTAPQNITASVTASSDLPEAPTDLFANNLKTTILKDPSRKNSTEVKEGDKVKTDIPAKTPTKNQSIINNLNLLFSKNSSPRENLTVTTTAASTAPSSESTHESLMH